MKKGMMMKARVPLQVYVEQPLSKRLRDAARQQGVPQARLVRRFIEDGLIQGELHPSDPALRLIAIGHGKTRDLARRHDAYLAEAYIMRERGVVDAFAYDQHFRTAGFVLAARR